MGNVIVPLSGGKSAELRRTAELTERQRRPVTRALALVSPEGQAALDASRRLKEDAEERDLQKKLTAEKRSELSKNVRFTAADLEQLDQANDLAILAFVKHWTRPEELTIDNILSLEAPDYDALREAVAPLTAELFVDFAPSKDTASPTGPSSDFATRSEGDGQIDSPKSGEPINSSQSG